MDLLRQMQDSAFSAWVLGADTIWSYPTVLVLHTVGLAILVGAAVVIDMRLLGIGQAVPLRTIGQLYRYVWLGFIINLASGLVLFIVQAADRAVQPVFYIKLAFIIVAFGLALRLRRDVRGERPAAAARPLAAISLVCWVAAIAAGRLMAYV